MANYRHVDFSGIHNIKLKYLVNPDTTKPGYYFKVTFDSKGRIIWLKFPEVGGQGEDPDVKYSIMSIVYSKDQEHRRYFNSKGSPMLNENGVFEEVYESDHNGFPVSLTNFNNKEEPTEDSFGICTYLYKTDEKGFIAECLRCNIKGDTIIDNKGCYRTCYKYNDDGFVTEQANYSKDGELTEASDGIALICYKYDSLGNNIEINYYDKKIKPRAGGEDRAASYKFVYNEKGQEIECRYFDETGAEFKGHNCPIQRNKYYENGRIAEYDCYCDSKIPCSIMKFTSSGAESEYRYFDSNGNLAIDTSLGYAAHIFNFNDRGYKIEEDYYDAEMKPIFPKGRSFSTIRYEYNDYNNLTKCAWYDISGKVCENDSVGCAFVTYENDYTKLIATATCRDIRGFIKNCRYGYAKRRTYYNDAGNIIKTEYIDKLGNLINDKQFDLEGRHII